MTVKRDQTTFKVPITDAFHRAAQGFYQHHRDPKKRKQIYLNTLSVQAVKFYLACLGIKADLEKSESWHPVSQVLTDIADLWVNDLGRLNCYPVLPELSTQGILLGAQGSDHIGYLFVHFDVALTEATLLGFISQESCVKLKEVAIGLDKLQSLATFPDYLAGLRQSSTDTLSSRIRLQPWLTKAVNTGWTSIDTLIEEWRRQNLALSFRARSTKADWIEPATAGIKQGKFLRLSKASGDWVLLAVGIVPAARNTSIPHSSLASNPVFDITIEVYPTGDNTYLPSTLHMTVMDEASMPVLQAKGRQSEGLEFQFSGRSGEQFSVHISCEQFTMTELFEI